MSVLMGRVETLLRDVDEELAKELRDAHVRDQIKIIVAGVLGTVVTALTGAGPLDWKAIAVLAGAALWTQIRASFPKVPLDLVQQELELRRPAPKSGVTTPGGGSGQ
jgi:hypothetical protein